MPRNRGKGAPQAAGNFTIDYLLCLKYRVPNIYFYVENVLRDTQTRVISLPAVDFFLSRNSQKTKVHIGKGDVYEVLNEYMHTVGPVNYTFLSATIVKSIIKELLRSRGHGWFQTTLYRWHIPKI